MHLSLSILILWCAIPLAAADLKLGIIGTDVSHVIHFSRILNKPGEPDHVAGARIIAAFKGGSADIVSSRTRVDKYADELASTYGVRSAPKSTASCWKAGTGAFTWSRRDR
jgi:hypothetical protein